MESLQLNNQAESMAILPCPDSCEGREERQCNACSTMLTFKFKNEQERKAEAARIFQEIVSARAPETKVAKLNDYRRQDQANEQSA